jgi:hypothetical protein
VFTWMQDTKHFLNSLVEIHQQIYLVSQNFLIFLIRFLK